MLEVIDLLIHSAAQVATIPPGHSGPQRGAELGDLGLVPDAAVAVHNGRVVAVGPSAELQARYEAATTLSAHGRCLIPGFVDCHTHLPWMGDRAAEFELRIAGASYMEIMAAGGGIMSTVRQTRAASLDDLVADNMPRLARMLAHGTTSAEAKTGYGLDTATEIKQLEAIKVLNESQPVELTATFLPAHAIPEAFAGDTEAYVDYVITDSLPAGAAWMRANGLTLACDVFCEDGVFDVAQTRRILEAARDLGYSLKVHADEFVGLGGTGLAVELGALSADHLVSTPATDITALGGGQTIAVGLPGTPFGLAHHDYTPARAILAAGGALAIASDLNPGTSWCESMQMVMALACRYMKLTPAEALVAATRNPAYAIGRGGEVGTLVPGAVADVLILTVDDYRHLGYRYGTNLAQAVFKDGRLVAGVAPGKSIDPWN